MSEVNRALRSSQTKRIVTAVFLVGIVSTSVGIGINQNWFDFGNADGIFPVLSSPNPQIESNFLEGEPIIFNATVYKIQNGEIEATSNDDLNFLSSLNFKWKLRLLDWDASLTLSEGVGVPHIALSSLNPGNYEISIEVSDVDNKYEILDPNDYLIDENQEKISYSLANFTIHPLVTVQSWISYPADYSNHIEGESLQFKGIARTSVNSTVTNQLVEANVNVVNQVNQFIDKDALEDKINTQLPDFDVNSIVSDIDYLEPIQLERLIPSESSNIEWIDTYVDLKGKTHENIVIGTDFEFSTTDLQLGFHTIKMNILDELSNYTSHSSVNLWISNKTQPTVPYLNNFYEDVVLDGNFILDWDSSLPTAPNTYITQYQVQQVNRTDLLYLDDFDYIDEHSNYNELPFSQTYMIFEDVVSTTDLTIFEDGKIWFRVRSIDNNGIKSQWSNLASISVDREPSNIYCGGVINDELGRVDLHYPEYLSQYGEVINSQMNDNFLESGEYNPKLPFFDMFEGQVENYAERNEFNAIYDEVPTNLIQNATDLLQYQNFHIDLQRIDDQIPIDPDTLNLQLRYSLYSNIDGKLYSGKGFENSISISWDDHIFPYLTSQGNTFCGLSSGVHFLTILIQDTFDIVYQIPSLVVNITGYQPNWENITLCTSPMSFIDFTGDGRHDLTSSELTGALPNLNPYYPLSLYNKSSFLEHWYIKIQKEYGNETFEDILKLNSSVINTTQDYFTYFLQNLSSGNFSFSIAVEDVHGWISDYSELLEIKGNDGDVLSYPFDTKLPILLAEDNPPPNPVIELIKTEFSNEIIEICSNESLILNASSSSDLNGDTLEYTWYFDDVMKFPWIQEYDPHGEFVEISPEICGNDLSEEFETDMRDGDQYGDWGVHKITLDVFDGVSNVNTSKFIKIIPPNVNPELEGLQFFHGFEESSNSMPFIYDTQSARIFPTGLFHFDHDLNPQDLSLTYTFFNYSDGNSYLIDTITIPRYEFSYENPILDPNHALEYGPVLHPLSVGLYDIQVSVSDGYSIVETNLTFSVKEDFAPYDLGITLKNEHDIELEQKDGKYLLLRNQPVTFSLTWVENSFDSEVEITLSATGLGVIYQGQGIRSVSSLIQQKHFTKPGEIELTLIVRDPSGNSNSTSINLQVFYVTVLNEENVNTIARQNSISNQYLGNGYTKLTNFGDLERSSQYVNSWYAELGDDRFDTDVGYYAEKELSLDPAVFPQSDFVRVWFQLDSRFDKDVMEFYNKAGECVWRIRRHSNNGLSGYQYQDGNGDWQSLYQMQLTSTKENLQNNYVNDAWEKSISSRLVYVVIPGDTVSIKWKTGSKDSALTNVFGKRGFRLAYFEAIGESEIQLRSPLDLSLDRFNAFLGREKGSILSELVKRSWYELIEEFFENEWDSRWVEFNHEIDYLDSVAFELLVQFNRFTAEFRVQIDVSYDLRESPVVGNALGSTKLIVGGSGTFAAIVDPFTLKEASMSFFGRVSKEISIFALLGKMVGMKSVGSSLKKADKYLGKVGYDFPSIELYLQFQISGGYRSDLGWYGVFEVSVGASITFFKKMLYLGIDIGMYIGGSERKGFTWGLTAEVTAKIRITWKAIVGNYWWVPGGTLYSKKYTIYLNLPFF